MPFIIATVGLTVLSVALFSMTLRLRNRCKRIEDTLESVTGNLEHLQRSFQRFVPQDVVEDIIHRGVATRGERREITVMFADLVGFTAMSEETSPETVVRLLNGYFQTATRAIAQHNGYVSKFLGDGFMAFFGAPEPNPWQETDSVKAALALREALAGYNETLERDGLPPLKVSIGLHAGPVVAGVIGSLELVEYTVIGDTVNTASRIEGLTRKFETDILLSQSVRDKLDDRFDLIQQPAIEVKGKAEPVHTWSINAYRD